MSDVQGMQFSGFHLIIVVLMVILWVVMLWAYVRIIQKAGYSGWNVLWMLVPIANIVVFLIFAFGRWPIEERLAQHEKNVF